MLINSITELNTQPAVILLYPAGSSGEFIASALTESITDFAKTQTIFENIGRVQYFDFLGRSLNSGNHSLDHDLVIKRANIFLEQCTSGKYLILSHPDQASINFIHEYLPDLPVIEIVIHNPKSKLFRKLAALEKIPMVANRPDYEYNYDSMPSTSGEIFNQHLNVEWENLMLSKTDTEYIKITEFLNVSGDIHIFKNMLADYILRNEKYIHQVNKL